MSDHRTIWDKQMLVNDLQVHTDKKGGFHFVELVDTDDEIRFILGEQEIVALRNYLNEVIRECRLTTFDPPEQLQIISREEWVDRIKQMEAAKQKRVNEVYGEVIDGDPTNI